MDIKTDFLVIGSGLAGLSFAIKASRLGSVAVITKKNATESSTNYAQGGIAAVTDTDDSFELHIGDTLRAGAGLCREDVVRFVVREGPERIAELIEWGVEFSRRSGDQSPFDLGKEGGHSRRRVLHAADSTGREIERALLDKTRSLPNVRIYENSLAIDLILESKIRGRRSLAREERDRCLGAYVFDIDHDRVDTFRARFTVLASGGGDELAREELCEAIRDLLLPLTTLVTPNSIEARRLAASNPDEEDELSLPQAAHAYS